MPRTALRICPLCEATCGLTPTVEGARVTRARGDRDDVFGKGFVCPKGALSGEADADPDRLRGPLVRKGGRMREVSWEEAFDVVAAGLRPVVEQHGPHAVAVVLGNPNVHTMAGALYPPVLPAGLGTRSLFTASTVDQMPKHVSSGLLYGDAAAMPVPDLDRTGHLLLLGASPWSRTGACAPPRTSRAGSGRSRHAAAPSPSSTRAGPVPPASPRIREASTSSPALCGSSHPRRSPARATWTPVRSARSPASWPRPRRPRSTGASEAAPFRTAPSRAGWSTCSTSSPKTWTGPGTRMRHAARDPGVDVNRLLDGSQLGPLSGNAVLDGVPVVLAPTE